MSQPTHIYEAVDTSDDEAHYPIGVYLTLEDAIADMTHNEGEPGFTPQAGDGRWDSEERATIEIREREIGGFGQGKKVWERTWEQDYSEEMDEYPWIAKEEEA